MEDHFAIFFHSRSTSRGSKLSRCHGNLQMGRLPECVCYIHLQSPMAWNQDSVATRIVTSGSTGFGNPSVQNQVEGVDQWHSQEAYSGMHDYGNLCRWISKAWAAPCTHSHLFTEDCKPHMVEDVDYMINAELPNSKTNKLAHETVARCMMHGPCGTTFPNAPCIVTNPLWPSVGVKPNTWKSWRFGVLRDSRMFRARQQGPKHLALGCSWCHWKGLET